MTTPPDEITTEILPPPHKNSNAIKIYKYYEVYFRMRSGEWDCLDKENMKHGGPDLARLFKNSMEYYGKPVIEDIDNAPKILREMMKLAYFEQCTFRIVRVHKQEITESVRVEIVRTPEFDMKKA